MVLVSKWKSESALYDQFAMWDITTCSLLDFLDTGFHSPKMGWIWKSLLWMLLLHCCCHFVWRNLLIVGFRSVYGILDLSTVRSKVDLAAKSALSFPLTPMWLHPHSVVANVPDCNIIVSKFKLQQRYYVQFQTNTLRKGMNHLILPAIV